MPYVDIDGPNGAWRCCYVISTPTKVSAESVDPCLPTIVFVHSICIGKETFEPQFKDPVLRQFNLVAFDCRGFGETGGIIAKRPWLLTDVSNDLNGLLDALNLPPCHLFGIGAGSYVALDLAAKHPEKVLSVMVCSPVPPTEPANLIEGHRQIYEYISTFALTKLQGGIEDSELADDTVLGAAQLLFNVAHEPLIHAIERLSWAYAIRNWTESLEHLNTCKEVNLGVHLNRKPLPKEHLAKIRCSITIIHCSEDVAYGIEVAYDLERTLTEARLHVSPVREVPGPHLGNFTHPEKINCIIYDTIVSCLTGDGSRTCRFKGKRTGRGRLETPFLPLLIQHGYRASNEWDESDESD